jgi:adenine/guanine phosphoribosyltransferase-like PRPP-binding protein
MINLYLYLYLYLCLVRMEGDQRIKEIRDSTQIYENFPKKGISFLDIFPIVSNPKILGLVTDIFAEKL